jgi:hypothetical protein
VVLEMVIRLNFRKLRCKGINCEIWDVDLEKDDKVFELTARVERMSDRRTRSNWVTLLDSNLCDLSGGILCEVYKIKASGKMSGRGYLLHERASSNAIDFFCKNADVDINSKMSELLSTMRRCASHVDNLHSVGLIHTAIAPQHILLHAAGAFLAD